MRLCRKCGDTSECEHDWLELPDDYVAELDHLEQHGVVASSETGRRRVEEIRGHLNKTYEYFLQALARACEGAHDEAAEIFQQSVKRIKIIEGWSARQSANFRVQHTLSWMRDLDEGTDD